MRLFVMEGKNAYSHIPNTAAASKGEMLSMEESFTPDERYIAWLFCGKKLDFYD